MHLVTRRRSRSALLLALFAELLIDRWWRWPYTTAPIQTAFEYGTGHVTVVSEHWRRFGAFWEQFLPVMSIDPDLIEWPYRGYDAQAPPAPPSNLHVTSNRSDVVVVSWAASITRRASYVLEDAARDRPDALTTNLGRHTSYTASGIQPGTYDVRVRAKNLCGTSGPSNDLVVVVE